MLNKITLSIAHSQVNTKFGLFFFTLAVHSLIKLIRVTLHKYPVHTSYRKSKNILLNCKMTQTDSNTWFKLCSFFEGQNPSLFNFSPLLSCQAPPNKIIPYHLLAGWPLKSQNQWLSSTISNTLQLTGKFISEACVFLWLIHHFLIKDQLSI